jgi:hypothetical protein
VNSTVSTSTVPTETFLSHIIPYVWDINLLCAGAGGELQLRGAGPWLRQQVRRPLPDEGVRTLHQRHHQATTIFRIVNV